MKALLTLIGTQVLFTPYAFSQGHEQGNGGSGWVCREDDGKGTLRWVELMDLWEGAHDPELNYTYDQTLSYDQAMAMAIEKLKAKDTILAGAFELHMEETKKLFLDPLAEEAQNVLPEDATFDLSPAQQSCKNGIITREAIALYRVSGKILPRGDLYQGEKGIKPLAQVALLAHESMFSAHREIFASWREFFDKELSQMQIYAGVDFVRQQFKAKIMKISLIRGDLFYGYPATPKSDLTRKIVANLFSNEPLTEENFKLLKEIYERIGAVKKYVDARNEAEWSKIRQNLASVRFSLKVIKETQMLGSRKISSDEEQSALKAKGFQVVDETEGADYELRFTYGGAYIYPYAPTKKQNARFGYLEILRKDGTIVKAFEGRHDRSMFAFVRGFPYKKVLNAVMNEIK